MAEPQAQTTPQRKHRATYATDKRKGGWLVRVVGPQSGAFVGREVPVTMRDGKAEHYEMLTKLIWSGKDQDTGEPVSLYNFEAKPREDIAIEF